MNSNEMGGIAIAIFIAIVGSVKIEIIKEVVRKITSDKEKITPFSLLFLAIIIAIPLVISYSIPNNESETIEDIAIEQPIEDKSSNAAEASTPKTELEVKVDAVKDGIRITDELIRQAKESKRKKDSAFVANRSQRWVIQYGDWMDDDESVLTLYKKLSGVENISLFKYKRKFFLFKELQSKEELNASLDSLKSELAGITTVNLIDLMTYCDHRKEKIVKIKDEKIGKRKGRIEIECYTIDK